MGGGDDVRISMLERTDTVEEGICGLLLRQDSGELAGGDRRVKSCLER